MDSVQHSAAQKGKANDNENDSYKLGSKGWDLMKRMGWVEGEGLGAQGQGRLQPVEAKIAKSRQGLGTTSAIASDVTDDSTPRFRVLDIKEEPNGPHSWSKAAKLPPVSADSDLSHKWSRWSNSNEDADLPALALQALQTVILPPTSPAAFGLPIVEMEKQSKFCSEDLLFEMLFYKNSLDKRGRDVLSSGRTRSNPYETVRGGIFINRAAMKMANLDAHFEGLFSQAAPSEKILHFADICAGPGGFSEYLTWRRGHPFKSTSTSPPRHFPRIRGYGMTLAGPCDFQLGKFLAGPPETFHPFYGSAGDGDITKWENLSSFSLFVARKTEGEGVHVVMADGGFDVSDSYNLQEVKSKHIYLCQCLCALTILRPGGCFVTKLFDTFTSFSVDLIFLMAHVFKRIFLIKPVSSRPANSERYLVCEGLISSNATMAGCPQPPFVSSNPKSNIEHSTKTSKRSFKQSTPAKRAKAPSYNRSGVEDCDTVFHIDTDSAVGLLIHHFLEAGEELHRRNDVDKAPSLDLLRLSRLGKELDNSAGFADFITRVNEDFVTHQCIYLSKLIIFADNGEKQDDSQDDMRTACLEKWQVPAVSRELSPWPLWSGNIPQILKSIIRDWTKAAVLNSLPACLHRPVDISPLTRGDLTRPFFSYHSLYAVVLGELIRGNPDLPKEPVMVLSLGGGLAKSMATLKYSCDCRKWEEFKWTEGVQPRLPAGSLVWALVINVYSPNGLRRPALMLLDAAFIYGIDLQSLPYLKRMEHIRELCDTLDFTEDSVKIVQPPCFPLTEIHTFFQQLKDLPCKDLPPEAPMFDTNNKGCTCPPRSLLLVEHLAKPWSMRRSRRTGQLYYFNEETLVSDYDLPDDVGLTFSQTRFFRVPWSAGENNDVPDAFALAELTKSLKV